MIQTIRNIVSKNRVIIYNFSFLGILQISNLVIFLLMIPYLFRVLGDENYGLVVFAQTISIYFSILVNFGFNATATRDISIERENRAKRSEIISSVLTLKVVLFILSMVVISVMVFLVPIMKSHPRVFLFAMMFCLSEALFPIWYFQGIEKMKYITYINVGTRIFSALMVISTVDSPSEYYLVPLLLGLGTVSGAVIGLFILFVSHDNYFKTQKLGLLRNYLKTNFPLFLSNVSSQAYVNANRLVVGTFMGMQDLAIYDIAERLINLIKVPISVVGQVLFPKISRDRDLLFLRKAMVLCLACYSVIFVLLYFFSDHLIYVFTGEYNAAASNILRILGLSIIPIVIGLFFCELMLVPFGYIKEYSKVRTGSLFIYFIIILSLGVFSYISLYSLAITVVVVEIFVLLSSWYYTSQRGLKMLRASRVSANDRT